MVGRDVKDGIGEGSKVRVGVADFTRGDGEARGVGGNGLGGIRVGVLLGCNSAVGAGSD